MSEVRPTTEAAEATADENADPARHGGVSAALLRLAALAPLVAGFAVYALHPDFRAWLGAGTDHLARGDLEKLAAWARDAGAWAPMATTLLMIVQAIAAPIPAVLVTATNSLLFGPFLGGLLSIASATLAASICWLIGAVLGDAVVARLLPAATLARADRLIREHGAFAVLAARLVPIVPFDPVSYAAGIARMRFGPFVLATFVGQIPAGMTYSYLAQEVDRPARFIPMAVGAFAALLLFGWLARRAMLGSGARAGDPDQSPEAGASSSAVATSTSS